MAKAKAPKAPPLRYAWDLAQLELSELSALKAIAPEAVAAIDKLCGANRNPFRDGGEDGRRATDYACGKLSIANMLRELRAMPMPAAKQPEAGPHAVPKGAPPGEP